MRGGKIVDWIFSTESKDGTKKCGHQHYLKAAAEECAKNCERRYRKPFQVLHWTRQPVANDEMLVTSEVV